MKSVFVTLNLFEKNQRCKILEDLQVYVVRQANVLTLSLSLFSILIINHNRQSNMKIKLLMIKARKILLKKQKTKSN